MNGNVEQRDSTHDPPLACPPLRDEGITNQYALESRLARLAGEAMKTIST
jgi:hypothetical protein